jgi:ubiquinone/menaquinone biosynthesis C-methylase UbiE
MNTFARGLAVAVGAGLLVAGARVYSRRARERVASQEGLEDPEVARAFSRVARMPQMKLIRQFVARRAVQLVPRGEAADLGCGPGYLVVDLAQQAPQLRITGIDLSAEMLEEAEAAAERAGIRERAAFKLGDVDRIPLPDQSLDLVVSTLSLHHWSDPAPVLDEVARVLRLGGAYLIFDLRRDMAAPIYVLLWFATRAIVPAALRRAQEPLGSRNAAYTPQEAAELARKSALRGWRIASGPFWLAIEGRLPGGARAVTTTE